MLVSLSSKRIYMQKNDVAISADSSYDGAHVSISFERYPLMVSLAHVSPNEARTFAAMLIEQANECERVARESAQKAAALAADNERLSAIEMEAMWERA